MVSPPQISLHSSPYQPFFVPVLLYHLGFFFNLLPDSFLLHGLHFLSTGNYTVYNLFLFIGQVWTRTWTWFHGPAAPVNTFSFLNSIYHLLQSKESRYICHRVYLLTVLDRCVKDHTSEGSMGNKEEHCNSNLKKSLMCLTVILTQHACSSVCC